MFVAETCCNTTEVEEVFEAAVIFKFNFGGWLFI
eukprot:SAG31_NODE_1647_length_7645_cov_47.639544_2_plen_34_part_00